MKETIKIILEKVNSTERVEMGVGVKNYEELIETIVKQEGIQSTVVSF